MVAGCQSPVAEELLRLAHLLRYPDRPLAVAAGDSAEIVEFFDEVRRVAPEGLEELYTRTFDLNPVATLEVGWHLWGEAYERGRFLADLRALQEGLGVAATSELPDHLTVLLETIARMDDPTTLTTQIAPALEKIANALYEQGNPYRHLIAAAKATRTQDSGLRIQDSPPTQHSALSTQHSPEGMAS